MLYHFTLRTRFGQTPFLSDEFNSWTWKTLRSKFPKALAAVLMPDHLHLVVGGEKEAITLQLKDYIRKTGRLNPVGRGYWDVPSARESIPNDKHLRRVIRYVHLNPCRSDFAKDPLYWKWSTHWDWVGAVADPWIGPNVRKSIFPHYSPQSFHYYVSNDSHCQIGGTEWPTPVMASPKIPNSTPERLKWAIANVLRLEASDIKRSRKARVLFTQTALKHGLRDRLVLSEVLDVAPQSVNRYYNLAGKAAELDAVSLQLKLLDDVTFRNKIGVIST